MKKRLIQCLFAILPIALFSQGAFYIEFSGSGIQHKGVIVLDDTGKGTCLIGFQMNGQSYAVLQDAAFSTAPIQNQTSTGGQWKQGGWANGWQTGPPQQQQLAYFITCTSPRYLQNGQPATNYTPDNFVTVNGQMIVKTNNLVASVTARKITSEQELTNILQQLGVKTGGTTNTAPTQQNGKAVPPKHIPRNNQPPPSGNGPKYPMGKGGGFG